VLGGGLHLDEPAGAGHDDVHVHARAGIFVVAEIQHGDAVHQAHAGGGDEIEDRHGFEPAELDELAERQRQRHERRR
jgi:hypothetical protein